METIKCHLCGSNKKLQKSHVWPKFAFKRFAADQNRGGRFADLSLGRVSNIQCTRNWFCCDCEKIFSISEMYVANLCYKIIRLSHQSYPYNKLLLRFAVSLSWRAAKYFQEMNNDFFIEWDQSKSYKIWKKYLLERKDNVDPYTIHLFVLKDQIKFPHTALGGFIDRENSLLLTQIGPMFFVSLMKPNILTHDEMIIWNKSKISHRGGTLEVICRLTNSTNMPYINNMTPKLQGTFLRLEETVRRAASSGNWPGSN